MRSKTEPESTVPLENILVTAENGEITGTDGTSNADLLVEIQKLRTELIVVTEENRRIQKNALQELESKIEDNKKNLNEISDKLQSVGPLMSKLSTSNDNPEKSSNTTNVSKKSVKHFKLKHVFKDVSNFAENVMYYGERKDHYNFNWSIGVKRHENHLGFYVGCKRIAPVDNWSCRAITEYKLVGPEQNNLIRTEQNCYRRDQGFGFSKFFEWEEMKKWYIVNGNLTVEAKVTIVETTGLGKKKIRKFDESQKDVSDVVLVARDTKFYVSKMFLASQSSVFKALLFGNFEESRQSEVSLNGIDSDDFHYFLEVLYGESAIDDTNVEGVALLADMYGAPTAIRKCEEFILKESKMTLEKKLKIATRYNLERLKALESLVDHSMY
ncbi:hypothetical protein B9Z55_007703 [Caenorhabditis nigoni]|nr:hypothetical protein B9Z55_007703 [Caenorhabditis nigoni]